MHVSPKLTAQVTLPKAAFSPSEHYFQADMRWGRGSRDVCCLVGGVDENCLELGVRERERRDQLQLRSGNGGGKIPKVCSLHVSGL